MWQIFFPFRILISKFIWPNWWAVYTEFEIKFLVFIWTFICLEYQIIKKYFYHTQTHVCVGPFSVQLCFSSLDHLRLYTFNRVKAIYRMLKITFKMGSANLCMDVFFICWTLHIKKWFQNPFFMCIYVCTSQSNKNSNKKARGQNIDRGKNRQNS